MNAKMLVLMMAIMLGGCATAPLVELNGQVPPQKLIKGASAVLIKKRIEIGPDGPIQACDYTVTLAEKFTIYSDICMAYIAVPKEVIADIEAHPGQKPEEIKTVGAILPSNTWNTANRKFTMDDLPKEEEKPARVYGAPIEEPIFKKDW